MNGHKMVGEYMKTLYLYGAGRIGRLFINSSIFEEIKREYVIHDSESYKKAAPKKKNKKK